MDPTLASQVIESQFPELAPARIVLLGEGCDSTAFEVNGEWVFRFPKRRDVEEQLEIERRILPLLAERLPVRIPIFRFIGRSSPDFPRGFSGYPRVPGVPAIQLPPDAIRFEALAGTIGSFLSALHAHPLAEARDAGVPESRVADVIRELQAEALQDFVAVAETAPDAPLGAWRRFLEAGAFGAPTGRVALVHNDLAAEHVLVTADGQAVTGIIDWADMAISEPETDFAGLFHWGGAPLASAVLAAYEGDLDAHALLRARYLGACRGSMDVAFGVKTGRPEYVASGLRALRHCVDDV